MWRCLKQSVIGTSHHQQDLPCQDYSAYQILGEQVLLGAVADGAGSAKFAALGAQLAVERAILFLKDVDKYLEKQPLTPKQAQTTFTKLLEEVQSRLQSEAEQQEHEIKDLACTLLVLIATPDWLAAMQIGDGFILMRPRGKEYQLLFQPDKGEYINETTFVTSTDALEKMQIKVLQKSPQFICAATDGVEQVCIDFKTWQPFPPFFHPLEQYLQETERPLEEDLKDFLSTEHINARTTDDKTLLVALWS